MISFYNKIIKILNKSNRIFPYSVINWEAKMILAHVFYKLSGKRIGLNDVFFIKLNTLFKEKALNLVKKRSQGIPLNYVIGEIEFGSNIYKINSSVLIPRQETEILVQELKCFLNENNNSLVGYEIGLGSGVISIEALNEKSNLKMIASEISLDAIKIARLNAKSILGSSYKKLEIIIPNSKKEVFGPFLGKEKADFLVSNPPYLDSSDEFEESLKFEPMEALFLEKNTYFYSEIAKNVKKFLSREGVLFLEVNHKIIDQIKNIFKDFKSLKIINDLSNRSRVIIVRI